jgi:hypothetical protein
MLKIYSVANAEVWRLGVKLNDVLRPCIGPIDLWIAAGQNIALNVNDRLTFIKPHDVDRELHVFHPKPLSLRSVKYKQHGLTWGNALSAAQAARPFCLVVCPLVEKLARRHTEYSIALVRFSTLYRASQKLRRDDANSDGGEEDADLTRRLCLF